MAGEQIPDFGGLSQLEYNKVHVGQIDIYFGPDMANYDVGFGAPGKYLYLGRVVPDSVTNDFTPQFLDIITGTPGTAKESYIIGQEGKVGFGLMEPSALAYAIAAGHQNKVAMFDPTDPGTTTTAAGPHTADAITLTAADDFKEGDEIEVEVGTGLEYTKIIGFTGAKAHVYPFFSAAPAAGADVKRVDGWKVAVGGSKAKKGSLLIIHTDADHGAQIVTHLRSARSGGLKDEQGNNKQVTLPLEFMAFGTTETGITGPVVATKYILKSAGLKLNPQALPA